MINELLLNEEIYERVIKKHLPMAQKFVWIATADIKDMHVEHRPRKFDTFLAVFADLVRSGVEIRLIHAKDPGGRFRDDFDRFPELLQSDRFDRVLCVRNHMKCILIDGKLAFFGSANLTGAGMGAKSTKRRNFEVGLLTDEPAKVARMMEFFDSLFMGEFCQACERRDVCPDPIA